MGNEGQGRPALSLVPADPTAAFYASRVAEHGGPALVLGSASGAVPWELGSEGVSAVGVEPSPAMLELAEARRQGEAPEVSGRVSFVGADVRSVRLEQRFGAVLAPHSAFGLLASYADLEALLATARFHLRPDGLLLFDVALPAQHLLASEAERPPPWAELRPVFVPHLRQRRRAPEAPQPPPIHRLRLRQFSPAELDAALSAAGFEALERYGDFHGKPFDPGDPLAIVIAAPGRRGATPAS